MFKLFRWFSLFSGRLLPIPSKYKTTRSKYNYKLVKICVKLTHLTSQCRYHQPRHINWGNFFPTTCAFTRYAYKTFNYPNHWCKLENNSSELRYIYSFLQHQIKKTINHSQVRGCYHVESNPQSTLLCLV